jgi:hypothetical protein
MKKLILIISSIFLIACGRNNINNNSEDILKLDYNTRQDIQLSEYIDSIKIVKLETSEEVLLGSFIRKVQIFDDRLFILDFTTASLFIFTETGKFIHKIYSIGQGPGEYITLYDCYVNSKGVYLLALGAMGNIILHYDRDWKYVRTIVLEHCVPTSFISDGEYFWLYTEPGVGDLNNQVLVADSMGKIINCFLEHPEKKTERNWASSNTLLNCNNEIYFSPRYGNTVYKWNKTFKWEKFITISAGDKTFYGNVNDLETLYNPEFPYVIRNYYYMVNDWFIFDFYAKEDTPLFCFHNTKTKQTKTGKIKSDLIPGFSHFYPVFQSDNYLISIFMAGDIIHLCPELCDFDISLKNLDEEDNPVLIVYKFK